MPHLLLAVNLGLVTLATMLAALVVRMVVVLAALVARMVVALVAALVAHMAAVAAALAVLVAMVLHPTGHQLVLGLDLVVMVVLGVLLVNTVVVMADTEVA